MRLIYADEAGTAPAEPVRVVAAVIVEADKQWATVDAAIKELINANVPTEFQKGFIFHGKEIFNGGKNINRNSWPIQERMEFFKQFLSIPRQHNIPIALGITFNGIHDKRASEIETKTGKKIPIPMHRFEHLSAFQRCMERTDWFIHKYLSGLETGKVVAEDLPEAREILTNSGFMFRDHPIEMTEEHLLAEPWQKELGIKAAAHTYAIRHIVDVPHFVDKSGAPILQLADACAFSFRRYLSRQTYGDDLVLAMLGDQEGSNFLARDAWFSGSSSGLFNTRSYWSEQQHRQEAEIRMMLQFKRLLEQAVSDPSTSPSHR
ncbi:DUF3800 domain-containing protein [Ancylobacter oerskovii]|uniref:DUF3800 domain-containing protein n=1 Tax=Ancylobacter oerskovii TaxID=459519 RepID=A0ABW4YX99_9HYPH|nr:DUF3800 domain-containing protein [Ancylobacter oerskovii]MBS7542219.1 DUF3800 domain-containing protein [Ancylobacter oerskovii]